MKRDNIIYWVATGFILLTVGAGSIADFLQIEAIKQSVGGLGFPLYMLPFFGTVKLLGSATIILPALKRFHEAAYAGIMFYFAGATYAHIAHGDGVDKFATTLVILAITIVSYLYYLKLKKHKD
ncbi:MAG: DoxX family protein [Saprospiraceae bacterium]|nr:DoxX family protein [Saprospiraceae bacterium]